MKSPLFSHDFHLVVNEGYQMCCVCYKLRVLCEASLRFFIRKEAKTGGLSS